MSWDPFPDLDQVWESDLFQDSFLPKWIFFAMNGGKASLKNIPHNFHDVSQKIKVPKQDSENWIYLVRL